MQVGQGTVYNFRGKERSKLLFTAQLSLQPCGSSRNRGRFRLGLEGFILH